MDEEIEKSIRNLCLDDDLDDNSQIVSSQNKKTGINSNTTS